MTAKRLWQTLRLWSIRGSGKRAAYARKNHIYAAIGNNVTIMDRKVVYSNLIRFHNNIEVALVNKNWTRKHVKNRTRKVYASSDAILDGTLKNDVRTVPTAKNSSAKPTSVRRRFFIVSFFKNPSRTSRLRRWLLG